jgi:hypothetical protein
MIGGMILKMSYIDHFIIYFRLFLMSSSWRQLLPSQLYSPMVHASLLVISTDYCWHD